MSSNLACLGFAHGTMSDFQKEMGAVLQFAVPLGSAGGLDVLRWEDPSGARVVFGLDADRRVVDLLPSFAGAPGVRLAECRPVGDDVVTGMVVDDEGEQTTSMAFELEQRRGLAADASWSGRAAVTAFANDVAFFADPSAFAASRWSLLDRDAEDAGPDGDRMRMAEESFLSWGAFGMEGVDPVAQARLNGTVVAADWRRNSFTGIDFLHARVSCLGFEVDLVAERAGDDLPEPGAIVATECFLSASAEGIPLNGPRARRKRWFRR
jgi:hypothetical protein